MRSKSQVCTAVVDTHREYERVCGRRMDASQLVRCSCTPSPCRWSNAAEFLRLFPSDTLPLVLVACTILAAMKHEIKSLLVLLPTSSYRKTTVPRTYTARFGLRAQFFQYECHA